MPQSGTLNATLAHCAPGQTKNQISAGFSGVLLDNTVLDIAPGDGVGPDSYPNCDSLELPPTIVDFVDAWPFPHVQSNLRFRSHQSLDYW